MDVKNLLGKLHASDDEQKVGEAPKIPVPPSPKKPSTPQIEDRVQPVQSAQSIPIQNVRQVPLGGKQTMREDLEDGIILDLGEGISLNIPIQRRMSLSDFIKLAEKVKALEMLSETSERYTKQY